jgi:hypothetical protein
MPPNGGLCLNQLDHSQDQPEQAISPTQEEPISGPKMDPTWQSFVEARPADAAV